MPRPPVTCTVMSQHALEASIGLGGDSGTQFVFPALKERSPLSLLFLLFLLPSTLGQLSFHSPASSQLIRIHQQVSVRVIYPIEYFQSTDPFYLTSSTCPRRTPLRDPTRAKHHRQCTRYRSSRVPPPTLVVDIAHCVGETITKKGRKKRRTTTNKKKKKKTARQVRKGK